MDISQKQRFRRGVYPAVDRFLNRVGLYASYTLGDDERAAVVHMELSELYSLLESLGFHEEAIFAALKYHENGNPSVGNFRYIDDENDDFQYHVHIFEIDPGVYELNCHHEYRWEPELGVDDPYVTYEYVDADSVPRGIPAGFVRSYVHYVGDEFYYSPENGVEWLRDRLDSAGIEYSFPG